MLNKEDVEVTTYMNLQLRIPLKIRAVGSLVDLLIVKHAR